MERFWNKVDKTDTCWNWTGAMRGKGYGGFKIDGASHLAHRVAWTLSNGPIPEGMNICHHCDNRRCVRPDHLFLGTQSDNMLDAVAKGRVNPTPPDGVKFPKGEKHPNAKLTETDVIEIRKRLKSGDKLAEEYGVDRSRVFQIWREEGWTHV